MHRNEIDTLLSPHRIEADRLDLIGLFANLATTSSKASGQEFSLWLNANNDHTVCPNESMAPVFVYNQGKCKKGCYECVSKVFEARPFVCVKSCEWRVGLNSYCNTMNATQVAVPGVPNLFVQSDHQIYVCKGDLQCVDFACQCPRGKRFVKDRSRCI